MPDLGRFLQRVAFHLPYSHDWLAERDALRNENRSLRDDLDALRYENHQVRRDLDRVREELHAAQAALEAPLWQPPGHFYSPIPDVADLQANWEKVTCFPKRPERLPDVDINAQHQLEVLEQFREWYGEMPFTADQTPERRYYFDNEYFSYTDAIVLYGMMRRLRPRRIIEVGSGFSSSVMMDVNDAFFGGSIELTFIEPYPERLIGLMKDTDRSKVRLLEEKVQDVDPGIFQDLESNDILFIDSSHVSKTGSDVNHLLFRILPALKDGVMIHFHDIFFPFEYPYYWVSEGRAWNEVYLLHAFLAHNRVYQIEFFNSYMCHHYRERIEAEFPLFLENEGGSLWLRKVAASS